MMASSLVNNGTMVHRSFLTLKSFLTRYQNSSSGSTSSKTPDIRTGMEGGSVNDAAGKTSIVWPTSRPSSSRPRPSTVTSIGVPGGAAAFSAPGQLPCVSVTRSGAKPDI